MSKIGVADKVCCQKMQYEKTPHESAVFLFLRHTFGRRAAEFKKWKALGGRYRKKMHGLTLSMEGIPSSGAVQRNGSRHHRGPDDCWYRGGGHDQLCDHGCGEEAEVLVR